MLELGDAQRDMLVKLAQSNTTEVRLARRASIVLLAADGLNNREIAQIIGVGRIQVGRWRERHHGTARLDGTRPEAAPRQAFQGLAPPEDCRET